MYCPIVFKIPPILATPITGSCFPSTRINLSPWQLYLKTKMLSSRKSVFSIMERHVNVPQHTKNTKVFFETFKIVSTLAFLTSKTWREDETYEIIEQGWKQAHGNYFLYVFEMRKPVGVDPWGFPSMKLAIYYS